MHEPPIRWPVRRYGWIVVRFLLCSGLVFILWPWLAPAYIGVLGRLTPLLLKLFGFNATLFERSARTLQFDVIYGDTRGLITPLSDLRPILLNMATLVGLFSGAFLPPRPRALPPFLLAALLLLLHQSVLAAHLVVISLPAFAASATLAALGNVLLASRSFIPLVLWLWLDAGARARLGAVLARLSAAPNARPLSGDRRG